MAVESIVQAILDSRRDLTREDIIRMIDEKVNSAKGYFTREFAAHLVASELGVQAPQVNLQSGILVKDLVSGLGDVTVTGRVIRASPFQVFTRSDGTEGGVKRLLVADKSGVVNVALWNDKAKLAEDENVKPGHIVKFSHGYVREGMNGKIELSLGTWGEIEVLPKDGLEDEYPPLESFIKRIGEITEKCRRVDVSGFAQQISPGSVFKRKDGSEGRTRHLWLRDSTGQIRVVFWNGKVAEIEDLREGSLLRIMNARVRSQIGGQFELHVEEASSVVFVAEKPSGLVLLPTRFVKVKEITEERRNMSVLARVAYVGDIRKFDRPSGARYLSQLIVEDETGSIQLNLWEDKALLSEQITVGDALLIEGVYARKRFGKTFLNLDTKGTITVNPSIKEAENLPQHVERIVRAADLREGEYVTVQGTVLTKPVIREVTTARKERVKVASFELSDNTGKIEVSLWGELAETAEKMSVGDYVKITNIYVKRDVSGRLKSSSSMLTSVERLPK